MLVTVNTGKYHLVGIRELLPHYVRCFLKNWMEHLTEPAPVASLGGSGVRSDSITWFFLIHRTTFCSI